MVNRLQQHADFPRQSICHMSCIDMLEVPVIVLCSRFSWNRELLFGSAMSSSGPCSPLLLLPFVLELDPQSTSRNLYWMVNRNISHHIFTSKEHLVSSTSYNNHIDRYIWEEFVLVTPFFIEIMINWWIIIVIFYVFVHTYSFTLMNDLLCSE